MVDSDGVEHLDVFEPGDAAVAPDRDRKVVPDLESWGNVLVPWRRPLFDFLVPPRGTKGRREGDRTVSFWWAGDKWKACLRAKDGLCVAFVTGETLGELFFALHQGLEKETLAWKEDKTPRKRK